MREGQRRGGDSSRGLVSAIPQWGQAKAGRRQGLWGEAAAPRRTHPQVWTVWSPRWPINKPNPHSTCISNSLYTVASLFFPIQKWQFSTSLRTCTQCRGLHMHKVLSQADPDHRQPPQEPFFMATQTSHCPSTHPTAMMQDDISERLRKGELCAQLQVGHPAHQLCSPSFPQGST